MMFMYNIKIIIAHYSEALTKVLDIQLNLLIIQNMYKCVKIILICTVTFNTIFKFTSYILPVYY